MLNIFLSGASSNNEFIVTLEGKENKKGWNHLWLNTLMILIPI